jgi:GT2 family glycosyltransferase
VYRVLNELNTTQGKFRYIVVNNSPDRAEMDKVLNVFKGKTTREVIVAHSESEWFTPALNQALRIALPHSRWVFYVCSVHTRVHDPRWMKTCLSWVRSRKRIGLAGSVVCSKGYGNRFDRSNLSFYKRHGRHFDYLEHINRRWWRKLSPNEKYSLPHVQGGVWLLRSSMIKRIGFPSENFFYSFVDVEYSFRTMSFGWQLGNIPGVWADQERFTEPIPSNTLISHAKRNAR